MADQQREWENRKRGASMGNPFATLCMHCMGRHGPPFDDLCPHPSIEQTRALSAPNQPETGQ